MNLADAGGGPFTAERPEGDPPHRRFPWRTGALYGLALIFLSLVVWRSRVWEAGDSFERVDALTIIVVPLLSLVAAVPLAVRGREIMSALGYRIRAVALIPVSFYGNTVGFLTPAASGELLRPSLLERGFGVPVPRGAAVVVYERVYSMYLMCLSGLFAFTWTGAVPVEAGVALLPIMVVLPLFPRSVLRLFDVRLERLSARFPAFVRSRLGGLSEASDSADTLWRSAGLALSFTVLSLVVFGLMAVQFWLLVEGTGENISLTEAWVVFFVANMAGVLSGLPLGLGASDAVMVSLLNAYGVELAAAAAIAVLVRVLINLPTGVLGLMAYVVAVRQSRAQPPTPGDAMTTALTPTAGEPS